METEKNVVLEGCDDHPTGCYIRFSNKKVHHSEEKEVVYDFTKKGELVGIELLSQVYGEKIK